MAGLFSDTSNIGETKQKKYLSLPRPLPPRKPKKTDHKRDTGHQRGPPDAPTKGNTSGDREIVSC